MLRYDEFYPQYREEQLRLERKKEKKHRSRLRLKEKKSRIIEEAKDVPCTDCKGAFPHSKLEFDHLRDKLFNIGGCRSKRNIGITKLLLEIAKCEVVCGPCHTARERARGRPR